MGVIAVNKKASFDYDTLESFEAGIALLGYEVKSIRAGQINLKGAYISFRRDEAYLVSAFIPLYKPAGNIDDYNPERARKLLLRKKELDRLLGKKQEKGLTVIPVKVYTKGSFIKLEIAVVKGKKLFDKREDSKKKSLDRELRTLIKKKIRG